MRSRTVFALASLTLVVAVGLAGCSSPATTAERPAVPNVVAPPSARAAADEVLRALQSKDGAALAALVHAGKGVRFSAYAHVDVAADVTLSRDQVSALWSDATVRTWGAEDGTGDAIKMTGSAYVARFVLDRDYSKASSVNTNSDRAVGNTVNNVLEAYPGAVRVEYYVEGTAVGGEPGNDWSALRLVFELVDGRYHLVGVIHDQWTI